MQGGAAAGPGSNNSSQHGGSIHHQRTASGLYSDPGAADAGDDASSSVAFEEFEPQPSRKGVYLQLLGESVEVVGERGTKVGARRLG